MQVLPTVVILCPLYLLDLRLNLLICPVTFRWNVSVPRSFSAFPHQVIDSREDYQRSSTLLPKVFTLFSKSPYNKPTRSSLQRSIPACVLNSSCFALFSLLNKYSIPSTTTDMIQILLTFSRLQQDWPHHDENCSLTIPILSCKADKQDCLPTLIQHISPDSVLLLNSHLSLSWILLTQTVRCKFNGCRH